MIQNDMGEKMFDYTWWNKNEENKMKLGHFLHYVHPCYPMKVLMPVK